MCIRKFTVGIWKYKQKCFADRLKKVCTREKEERYGTLELINANLENECLENDGTLKS